MSETITNEITLEEVISYSKLKETPSVSIIADITKEDEDYIRTVVQDRLQQCYFKINDQDMIMILADIPLAKYIALRLHKKMQHMYVDFSRRPENITMAALTGHVSRWIIVRDNGYQVKAYDEEGKEIFPFISTDIQEVEPTNLLSICNSKYVCSIEIKGRKDALGCYEELLEHSRENYLNGGVFNEERYCYYPKGDNYQQQCEINKLEKLFKKRNYKSL